VAAGRLGGRARGTAAAAAAAAAAAVAAKVFFRRNGTAEWLEISFILRFLPALAMSNLFSLDDVTKGKKAGGEVGLTNEQTYRHGLKCVKTLLLAYADPKHVSDQELRYIMSTEFGRCIGPYMRAVFPPQVTSVLQHPAPVPQQYRLELTEAEKRAAIAAPDDLPLPAPPHDCRDFFVTRGGEPISKLQHLSLIFSIPNFTGKSGLANQPHWFKNSGPYFGDSFTGTGGAGGAQGDRDFWRLEMLMMTASSFAPGASHMDHNPSYHQPQNEY
jgi:hypothetical protein